MNPAHLHLLLNHVPVLGTIFGVLLLIGALVRRNHTLLRVSFVAFIVAAAVAVPVFLTGEGAEERVEGQPGVTDAVIERHEDFSKIALGGAIALGVISLGAAIQSLRTQRTSPALGLLILVASVTVSGLMAWTANLGGEIRHTEIRSGAVGGESVGERNEEADD